MRICLPEHDIYENLPCACRYNTTAAISVMERGTVIVSNKEYKITFHNACPAHYANISTEWIMSEHIYKAFMRHDMFFEALVRRLFREAEKENDRRQFGRVQSADRMAPRFEVPSPVINLMNEILEHKRQHETPGQRSAMMPV